MYHLGAAATVERTANCRSHSRKLYVLFCGTRGFLVAQLNVSPSLALISLPLQFGSVVTVLLTLRKLFHFCKRLMICAFNEQMKAFIRSRQFITLIHDVMEKAVL